MDQERGLIAELIALQDEANRLWAQATPAERSAAARAALRHIAEVEDDAPDWYADA